MGFPISTDIFGQLKWLVKQVKLLQANVIRSVKTFSSSVIAKSNLAQGTIFTPTLIATANNDALIAVDINPIYNIDSFSNVQNYGLRVNGKIYSYDNLLEIGRNAGGTIQTVIYSTADETTLMNNASTALLAFRLNSTDYGRFMSSTGNFILQSGGTYADTTNGDRLQVSGNINLKTIGNKIKIATGTDASAGTVLLTGTATKVVTTTAVTSNSIILLTTQSVGGTAGFLVVSARSAGSSFTITSSTGTSDTSTVGWLIIN